MTALTSFFKESESSLGVFYPKHYVIATFKTFAGSEKAAQALRGAGFGDEEVLAIPGADVLKYFEEFRANSGLWSGVMTMLSRGFGTEQVFADDDVQRAKAGAGFLAVHGPQEADKSRVKALVTPFEPIAMHWYAAGGVECLI
jgi:hypothetical protein